jgi:hypothetical protein
MQLFGYFLANTLTSLYSNIIGNPPQVSNETLKFEDEWVSKNKGKRAEKGQLALRPAYGTIGRQIKVRANYFKIDFNPKVTFYSYIAKITPEPKAKRHLREIWKQILASSDVVKAKGASDNAAELITCARLGEAPVSPIRIQENGGDHKDYTVKLALNGTIDHRDIVRALSNPSLVSPSDNEAILLRALNILMAAYPGTKNNVITLGKGSNNRFYWVDGDQVQSADLQDGLQGLRGYYASVRPAAGSILLNLSVNHSAFYKPGSMASLWNAVPPALRNDRQLFSRYVKMLRVECTHLNDPGEKKPVPRVKTIWGLADPEDGKGEEHPPKFKEMANATKANELEHKRRAFGADAYSVKFFHREMNEDITVAKYFQDRMYTAFKPFPHPFLKMTVLTRLGRVQVEIAAGLAIVERRQQG